MSRLAKVALPTAALVISGLAAAGARGPWIAFRYSSTEVLLYARAAKDAVGFATSDLSSKQVPQPVARWGGGGYLMPLPRSRFSALQLLSPGEESVLRGLNPGATLNVRLSAQEAVSAVVERLVEQWGGANPEVQLGVIARIKREDAAKFQSDRNDYFLVYQGESATLAATPRNQEIVGPRRVLNDFGKMGQIIVVQGDDGWNVALWRHFDGKFMPTDIAYSYGD